MPAVPPSGRADLTDAQWAVLEPQLPRGKKPGRPRKWTRRQLMDGIRWRTRAGTPRRDVPERYGSWESVYGLSTQVHLACEQGQKPLSVVITAGQRGDSPQFQAVLGRIRVPRAWPGQAADPAGPGAGRQGLRLPRQPRLPAAGAAPPAP